MKTDFFSEPGVGSRSWVPKTSCGYSTGLMNYNGFFGVQECVNSWIKTFLKSSGKFKWRLPKRYRTTESISARAHKSDCDIAAIRVGIEAPQVACRAWFISFSVLKFPKVIHDLWSWFWKLRVVIQACGFRRGWVPLGIDSNSVAILWPNCKVYVLRGIVRWFISVQKKSKKVYVQFLWGTKAAINCHLKNVL